MSLLLVPAYTAYPRTHVREGPHPRQLLPLMEVGYLQTHQKEMVRIPVQAPSKACWSALLGGRTVPREQCTKRRTLLLERAIELTDTRAALARCKRLVTSISYALFALVDLTWMRHVAPDPNGRPSLTRSRR
jgi:hypothetical protein